MKKVSSFSVLELTATCGYLFLHLFLNILASFALTPLLFTIFSVYTCLAMSFFVVRNLQQSLIFDSSDSFATKSRVYYFLGFAGFFQFFLAFTLGVWPEFS